jgi:hypothetical protein
MFLSFYRQSSPLLIVFQFYMAREEEPPYFQALLE